MAFRRKRYPRTFRKVIWYRFSFRRFFGDVESHRVPILEITKEGKRLYIWKCGLCKKVFKSPSLRVEKAMIFGDIREHSGD